MLVVPEQKCKTFKQFQALNGFIFWSRLRLLKEIQGKIRMLNPVTEFVYFRILRVAGPGVPGIGNMFCRVDIGLLFIRGTYQGKFHLGFDMI